MTEILRSEGWDIPDEKVGKLRRKHKFVLRAKHNYQDLETTHPTNGLNTSATPVSESEPPQQQPQQQQEQNQEHHQDRDQDHHFFGTGNDFPGLHHQHSGLMSAGDLSYQAMPFHHAVAPAPVAYPQQKRTSGSLNEGNEQAESRKRRRRIRGIGSLPADEPGMPPRYKSETSLNECKAFLQLDNESYQALRQQYMAICNEAGIVKKTKCEPGQWEASKDRLIQENAHINAIMNSPHPDANEVANALEVVCADVTKRIRVMGTRISMQDANNGLQLNPAQSKHIRHLFYEILRENDCITKSDCGEEKWDQMVQLWITKSDILTRMQQQGIDDQTRKYLNVLTRDAMKRLTDSNAKKDPQMRQWTEGSYGPGPGAARGVRGKPVKPKAPRTTVKRNTQAAGSIALDPTLAMFAPPPAPPPPMPLPIEAVFHLAPESRLVGYHPKLWSSKLETCTVAGLHKAGSSKTGAAKIGNVYGIVQSVGGGETGQDHGADVGGVDQGEQKILIETDHDLVGYLQAAKDLANGIIVFLIELSGGYA